MLGRIARAGIHAALRILRPNGLSRNFAAPMLVPVGWHGCLVSDVYRGAIGASMDADRDYFERKQGELRLIARALGRSRCRCIPTIEVMIEEKLRLGAELRAKHALRTRDNTETNRKSDTVLRTGPFTFAYR
jgi:hypothetical protein